MTSTPIATLADVADALEARGDAPAVLAFRGDRSDTLDAAALARAARAAAAGLAARGIGAGSRVLLWAPNSPAWISSYFAIVESGAAAVPLDDAGSVDDARAVIDHAAPLLVLTSEAHAAELGDCGIDVLLLDVPDTHPTSWRRLGETDGEVPAAPPPDAVASLLYTSGTTGTPKAVPLTHANIAANVRALLAARLIESHDRVLVPLPFHHTYPFTVGLMTVLATGAVVVLPAGVSGPEISRAASGSRATVLLAVPRLCAALWSSIESAATGRSRWTARLFRALLAVSISVRRRLGYGAGRWLFRALHRRLGGHLRLIGCGGAKLAPELEDRLEGLGWRVLTGYGLTETSPVLTFNQPRARKPGTEGRPLDGVELRIAEPGDGQRHGEVLARGPNVFAGYWQAPEETRGAFTDDGWFRTGDLGWIDADRYLHVEGRSKELIVLPDGKNVYPEHLEKRYGASPLIADIAVLERDGALAALIVPDDDAMRERGTLRVEDLFREAVAEAAASLPRHQRIGEFRLTRRPLPRTRLGKLKRHELAARFDAEADAGRGETEPLSDTERRDIETGRAAPVWAWLEARYPDRTLTLDTSPQLDLGIDSLEWVTLTLEIERRFAIALDGEAVSRIVTLRDLVDEIERAPSATSDQRERAPLSDPPGPMVRMLGSLLLGTLRLLFRPLFPLSVTGADALATEAPLVITPNHASYLDAVVLVAALPRPLLARTAWAGWVGHMHAGPLTRLISRATRVFPVDPDRDLAGAIAAARRLLADGQVVVWFPEGRRSNDGRLGTFRPGIGLLLAETGAAAVPVALRGTFAAWPRPRRLPRPGTAIEVAFGAPVDVETLRQQGNGDDDAARIRDALERQVRRLLGDEQA